MVVLLGFPLEKPWNLVSINSRHALPRIVTGLGESSIHRFKFLTPNLAFGHTSYHEGLVIRRSTKAKNLTLIRPHMCSYVPPGFLHLPLHTGGNARTSTNRRTLLMSLWHHPMTSHMPCQQPRKFCHVNLSPHQLPHHYHVSLATLAAHHLTQLTWTIIKLSIGTTPP